MTTTTAKTEHSFGCLDAAVSTTAYDLASNAQTPSMWCLDTVEEVAMMRLETEPGFCLCVK